MAVRVIRGNEALREAFALKSKFNILLEKWISINQRINNIVNRSFSDFIEAKGENFQVNDKSTTYSRFLEYLINFQNSNEETDVYTWTNDINGNTITINFVVTKNPQRNNGTTNVLSKSHDINVFLDCQKLKDVIQNTTNKSIAIKELGDFITSLKNTTSHEVKHFFQLEKGELKATNFTNKHELVSYILEAFYFFCYFVERHEIEAFITSVYNLYRQKRKQKVSFFECLMRIICKRLGIDFLGKEFLSKRMSFKELLDNLPPHHKFVIAWVVFCYIPLYSNYKELLEEGMKNEDRLEVDKTLLDNNKKNLKKFFDRLSLPRQEKFGKLLKQPQTTHYYDLLFSLDTDNSKAIEEILRAI